jgi:hypothetical protein
MFLGLALWLLAGSGCAVDAATGNVIPDGYPTIAPATVNGRFDVVDAIDGDGPIPLDGPVPPMVSIDVVNGELRIEPDCNLYLGSFTLAGDGSASFTIAGGTREPCPSGPDLERRLLDLFTTVDRWAESSDGVELSGPDSARIELRRR